MNDQIIHLLRKKIMSPRTCQSCCGCSTSRRTNSRNCRSHARKAGANGEVARIKGNRYVSPRDADLIPGRIRMNRAGKGFLQPDDSAQGNRHSRKRHRHGVARRPRAGAPRCAPEKFRDGDTETGTVVRILERGARRSSARCAEQTVSLRHPRRPAHSA
jgi:hypothetical protein